MQPSFAIIYSEGEARAKPLESKKMKDCDNKHQSIAILLAGIFFGIVTIVVELNYLAMLQ